MTNSLTKKIKNLKKEFKARAEIINELTVDNADEDTLEKFKLASEDAEKSLENLKAATSDNYIPKEEPRQGIADMNFSKDDNFNFKSKTETFTKDKIINSPEFSSEKKEKEEVPVPKNESKGSESVLDNLKNIFNGELNNLKRAIFKFDSSEFEKNLDEIVENVNPFDEDLIKTKFENKKGKLVKSLLTECDIFALDDMKELFTMIIDTLKSKSKNDDIKIEATNMLESTYNDWVIISFLIQIASLSNKEWNVAVEDCKHKI